MAELLNCLTGTNYFGLVIALYDLLYNYNICQKGCFGKKM